MFTNRITFLGIVSLGIILTLAGCEKKATQTIQVNPGARETELYPTILAQLTLDAAVFTLSSTPIPSETIETNLPSPTNLPPTLTAVPVEPTQLPTITPTPTTLASGTLIWKDDFEGEKNWYVGSKEDSYTFEFLNGAYRIYNNLLGSIVWSIRGASYRDIRLEVDVMKHKGPKDGYYGLICRYVDSKNYYALVIGSDSTFGIVKMENGKLNFIQQSDLPAKLLKDKDEYNHIRADCIESNLILYVNNKKVTEIQDSGFTTGDVGIGVGNQLEAAGSDAIFDNFEIWQP
jgi:hypothetical protein